jgi:hypothetical protein
VIETCRRQGERAECLSVAPLDRALAAAGAGGAARGLLINSERFGKPKIAAHELHGRAAGIAGGQRASRLLHVPSWEVGR